MMLDWMQFWGNSHDGAQHFAETQPCLPFSDYMDAPFDFELFFSFFPEFKDSPTYSLSFISAAAKEAAMYIKPTWCRELDGNDRLYAYFLIVSHIIVLNKRQQAGLVGTATPGSGVTAAMDTMPGVMTSASVGGVSVSKTGITNPKNFWEEWFYQTPYGRKYLTFMEQAVGAGLYYEGEENIGFLLRE